MEYGYLHRSLRGREKEGERERKAQMSSIDLHSVNACQWMGFSRMDEMKKIRDSS